MLFPRAAAALHTAPPRVDLRSDTVTKPTAAMRQAMAAAEVGDDVFGDDPTVKRLEARVADMFGKEAAVFTPSGTMANLCAVLAHTWERGSEYVLGDRAHVFLYEQGGGAQLGGAHPRTVATREDGTLPLEALAAAVRADDQHYPRTTLACLEQTHNMAGGRVLPLPYVEEVGAWARREGIALHVDGARVWHAMEALGQPAAALAAPADSMAICLSKALGAPAGSLLVGSGETVRRARRLRKALGGGMRQAGILAAAGLHALDHHLDGLREDRRRAQVLAEGLAAVDGLTVAGPVETNIVIFTVDGDRGVSAEDLAARCAEAGVDLLAIGPGLCRCVTHLGVDDEGVGRAVEAARLAMEAGPGGTGTEKGAGPYR